MLNKSIFNGRLTAEPELRTTKNGDSCCNFQLAVDRNKSETADFPEFICYKKIAENLCRYVHKGDLISVTARYQSRIHEGKKYHEFKVEELYFLGSKQITEDYEDVGIPQ